MYGMLLKLALLLEKEVIYWCHLVWSMYISGIISADIIRTPKLGKSLIFLSSQLTCERRSLFQDMTWSFLPVNPGG